MLRFGTIRTRLTLWYVFFLAITILGFSIYLNLELQLNLTAQVDAGLQVAASQLLVDVDDSVDPPTLRPMSDSAVDRLMQSRSALRLIDSQGAVIAEVGVFPSLPTNADDAPQFETITIDGIPWRIFSQQVDLQNMQADVLLQIAQSLDVIYDARNSLLRLMAIGLPITLLAAAWGGSFMARRALQPVDAITRTVQAINASDMTGRIADNGSDDELGRLTLTLNSMLDRLEAAFDTERRFTADASHELRTPLTAIKGQIGVALHRRRSPEIYEDTLHHIQQETDRLIRLANDLLFLARLDAAPLQWQPEKISLNDLLGAVVDQVRLIATEKDLAFSADIPAAGLLVWGTADHLIRLFLNILDNAVKYTPAGGQISVTASDSQTEAIVIIRDTGPGIAEEHLAHLFERFYRVQRDRSYDGGAGLGLSIAFQIARAHSGAIEVDSHVGEGTSFIVRLPLVLEK